MTVDDESRSAVLPPPSPAGPDDSDAVRPLLGTTALLRAFTVLELMADAAGSVTFDELLSMTGLRESTLRRIISTFARNGYVLVESDDRLILGPRLIHLGATASLQLNKWAQPYLEALVKQTGVTASIAVLDSDEAVYLGQVASGHTLGTFLDVGRRVTPHSTAVGKMLLSQIPDDRVRDTLRRTGMPRRTAHTIVDPDAFMAHLEVVRRQRYAFDDAEQDLGVRCVAVSVPHAPRNMAMSLSAPESRMTITDAMGFIPALERTAEEFSASLQSAA